MPATRLQLFGGFAISIQNVHILGQDVDVLEEVMPHEKMVALQTQVSPITVGWPGFAHWGSSQRVCQCLFQGRHTRPY